MSIKQIFVPLTGLGEALHVPLMALKIAKRFDANVEGCDIVSDQPLYMDTTGFGMTPALYKELSVAVMKAAKDRSANARRIFGEACIKSGFSGRSRRKGPAIVWTSTARRDSDFFINAARMSDLTVVNLPGFNAIPADLEVLEQMVFQTGRPVLAVPENGLNELTGRIAIAWNGSVEATRAVAAAIPLMQYAKSVRIIQVGEPNGPEAGTLGKYLASHGIDSRILTPSDRKGSTGKIILEHAESENCGLLVMGAYTHSRVREMVLGGVTHHVFQGASVPVLMAH